MIKRLNDSRKVWIIDGKKVCTVTHPDYPNFSGHSRGRKTHLAKTSKFSICNMLVDEYVPDKDRLWSVVHNGRCKVCFNGIAEEKED